MKASGAAALFDRPVHVTVEAPTTFKFARYLEFVLAPPTLGRHGLCGRYSSARYLRHIGARMRAYHTFYTFAEVSTAAFFLLSSMLY